MNPKVSVVIPVYNSAKYLKECLNSIFVQTLEDWEVIAVNDGSSDESPTILDAYAKRDSRFQVVHKENGGVSAARNDGLSVARGEYVFFMDSDDILDKDAFQNLYGIAVAENADIVMGDHWAFQESEIGTDEEKRYVFFNENFNLENKNFWKKDYENPIEIIDISTAFIDNREKFKANMWISLDKDIYIAISESNIDSLVKYIYERFPY